jgi:hypothetical protein
MDVVLTDEHYTVKKQAATGIFTLQTMKINKLAVSNDYTSLQDAKTALAQFVTEFNQECDAEGLHLVEHLLLRPRNDQFDLHRFAWIRIVISAENRTLIPLKCRLYCRIGLCISEVLAFRNYFEDIIRQETPAHTMVKICWINDQSIYEFENAYKAWITALWQIIHLIIPK